MFIRGVRDDTFAWRPVRAKRAIRWRLAAPAAWPITETTFISSLHAEPPGSPSATQYLRRPMLKLAASALLCFALAMPTVAAAGSPPPLLGQLEGQAWSTLLATPVDQYPLADPCLELSDNVVAPLGNHTFPLALPTVPAGWAPAIVRRELPGTGRAGPPGDWAVTSPNVKD
jgi:hypothetical protein